MLSAGTKTLSFEYVNWSNQLENNNFIAMIMSLINYDKDDDIDNNSLGTYQY